MSKTLPPELTTPVSEPRNAAGELVLPARMLELDDVAEPVLELVPPVPEVEPPPVEPVEPVPEAVADVPMRIRPIPGWRSSWKT